jgi:hypothetical protein
MRQLSTLILYFNKGKRARSFWLPSIHAKNHDGVLPLAKGNNVLQTFRQVKFGHRPF